MLEREMCELVHFFLSFENNVEKQKQKSPFFYFLGQGKNKETNQRKQIHIINPLFYVMICIEQGNLASVVNINKVRSNGQSSFWCTFINLFFFSCWYRAQYLLRMHEEYNKNLIFIYHDL